MSFSFTSSNFFGSIYKHGEQLNKKRLQEKKQLRNLIKEYSNVFVHRLGKDDTFNHRTYSIKVSDHVPINLTSISDKLSNQLLKEKLEELLDQGIIEYTRNKHKWSSPASMKLINNKWELCVDYTELNSRTIETINTSYSPTINDILKTIPKDQFLFSKIVLKDGFSQLAISKNSKHLTAFKTDFGHFNYTRMNSQLKYVRNHLQAAVESATGSCCFDCIHFVIYLGQILVFSRRYDCHFGTLDKIFDRFNESNLKVDIENSYFLVKEIDYLGVKVNQDGLSLNNETKQKIRVFPTPDCKKELQSFLGLIGYYKDYCQNLDDYERYTSQLRNELSRSYFDWTQELEDAFNNLKACFGAQRKVHYCGLLMVNKAF